MRWVQQPAIRPHKCAVFPSIGSHNAHGPFLDTGQDMRDPDSHVYISTHAIQEMARLIGWEHPSGRVAAEAKIAVRDEQIAALKAKLADASEFQAAAEYTLHRFGSKVHKKPGRKVAG